MITWLIGDNTFEINEAVQEFEAEFSSVAERVDGTQLTLSQLPDILMGVSLFSTERLVIINDITQNSDIWDKLPIWLERISNDIHLVLIDVKPDKRTTSFKALKAKASLREFPAWTERDIKKAEQWVSGRAQKMSININQKAIQHLVARVGYNQWALANALDILALLDDVTIETINNSIAPNLHENIFQLFETVLQGNSKQAIAMLNTLSLEEDPYQLFALLSSQALTLAAVTFASAEDNPTKDFAIHPFVASKLVKYGKQLGKNKVSQIIEIFSNTDADMKRSKAEIWLLIEQLLLKTSQIANH